MNVDVPSQPRTRYKRTAPSPKCIDPTHSSSTPTHLQPSMIPRRRCPSPQSGPPCRNRTLHKTSKTAQKRIQPTRGQSRTCRRKSMKANKGQGANELGPRKGENSSDASLLLKTKHQMNQISRRRRVFLCAKPRFFSSTDFLTCRACCAT